MDRHSTAPVRTPLGSQAKSVFPPCRLRACLYRATLSVRCGPGDETALNRFEEAYLGHYDSEQAYAEQLIDDLGYQQLLDDSVPASLRPYARIDTEALARDMQLDGDLHFYPADDGGVWIFDGRV
ncbi:antirestriction protein ArdA [Rhodococcus zopfii]|uniref:antirestriction protein ArdA n=1 Tax=Rhodococcus zopfii TaxID=43772 RepID=UPI0036589FA1